MTLPGEAVEAASPCPPLEPPLYNLPSALLVLADILLAPALAYLNKEVQNLQGGPSGWIAGLILAAPPSAWFCLGWWEVGRTGWAKWWNINIIDYIDQSQPNPTIRPDGPPCSRIRVEMCSFGPPTFLPFCASTRPRQSPLSIISRRDASAAQSPLLDFLKETICTGMSNWTLHQNLKYSYWCLRDVILEREREREREISNSI